MRSKCTLALPHAYSVVQCNAMQCNAMSSLSSSSWSLWHRLARAEASELSGRSSSRRRPKGSERIRFRSQVDVRCDVRRLSEAQPRRGRAAGGAGAATCSRGGEPRAAAARARRGQLGPAPGDSCALRAPGRRGEPRRPKLSERPFLI